MKHLLISLGLFAGALAFVPMEASAMVCARGLYRAGCVGPNGGVAVRRGGYAPRVGMYGRGARVGMYGRGVRGVAFRRGGFRR
ncbi:MULTISPECIES: hypothetical protein [Methylobacterium]|uniref:Uncharacterized protein n=1 Tax=Methylobacterium thuringiense TaxID=1003091 RepID=A0ABQ4TNF1_9HYPH|nr:MULTISPECIES: hypothetical protein [Methylobacterium]TXN23938.1 hypothetical protein FV217_04515 [Methylobacterium sp. WL9]GJE55205.1 hypothetical protein EKPJFOCH_1694 [Methylobacterium thuringiense]